MLFDDITNECDRRQTIDDGIKIEDIFIGDNYLLDEDDTQETKNLCYYVLDDVDQNDILFKHKPVDDTPNYPSPPVPLLTFSDILLSKNKNGKTSQKKIKKYQKIGRW